MDIECLCLLPSVCEVLADSKVMLNDDTSLEKLLDWFKDLLSQSDGSCLLMLQPHLLQFLYSMTKSQATDPSVFSFSLKLAGLLASKEPSFTLLEERGVLMYMFKPDCWHMLPLWNNASVRYGWLQGLYSMLQHQQAVDFFCKNGFLKVVLHLQNDKSLFTASMTCRILARFLNCIIPPVLVNGCDFEVPSWHPVRTDLLSFTTEVATHVATSLGSEDKAVVLQALQLLVVILTECNEPLKTSLWKHAVKPLELLANVKDDVLIQPIMAVLRAVAKSPLFNQPECKVETLMDIMLYSRNINQSVHCATLILKLENCPEVLKRKATDVVLLPLLCATGFPSQLHGPDADKLKDLISHLEKQVSQKATCISLLTQSLPSISQLIYKKSLGSVPIQLITQSVLSLLRLCIGQHPFTLQKTRNLPHLIGCCKVQRCSMDVLGSLSIHKESMDSIQESFTVLLQYLQSPDSHATILKNVYGATLRWLYISNPTHDLWMALRNDFFPLLKKHACAVRWDVRDSTLEFITLLTAKFKAKSDYIEVLCSSGMVSVLFTSLSDVEGYVKASAVTALGEVVTACSSLQEQTVTHLLTILSQDTDSFPRRAVMKVFLSLLKSQHTFTALDKCLSSVLLLAGNDFDWEVKVNALELVDVLISKSQSCHSCSLHELSETTCATQELIKLKDLGLFDFVIKCLFDCDRPVSQKACALLLKLRGMMRESLDDHSVLTLEIHSRSWSEEMFHNYLKKRQVKEPNLVENVDMVSSRQMDIEGFPKTIRLGEVLEELNLDDMQHTLSLSSDHVINSPRSLMEDILIVAKLSEKKVVDCY